ncbi:hemerythrin domain-containing protein [Nannocystis sp. SCPEA4]|uniref:hemerythrin domain-containing protein n=1 Tax=Nannocystis sp. SCPEA4 TaxID=2996787 RepID=UPI00226F1C81|nr:hemerythrin domain-containing protein [Nannocystis sp. SCPEA4]MCY1058707.1 hemerythrin domain-containing protein [Nannocystis sp. SCPEA4]
MKRDPRLRGLSSEHHHALVLARTVTALIDAGRADDAADHLVDRFERELEPHFRVEEALLLPALRGVGEVALVERTEADHASLRALALAARGGRRDGLVAFAERLTDHVRFEERELFPCCEARLPAAVLDAVGQRS